MKYKKNFVRVKSFWIRICEEREGGREGGRERAFGARETFTHNFDFNVVQTAEPVYVIVIMWREINLRVS